MNSTGKSPFNAAELVASVGTSFAMLGLVILVVLAIFLVIRKFWWWYWGVSEILSELRATRVEMTEIRKRLVVVGPPPSGPSPQVKRDGGPVAASDAMLKAGKWPRDPA